MICELWGKGKARRVCRDYTIVKKEKKLGNRMILTEFRVAHSYNECGTKRPLERTNMFNLKPQEEMAGNTRIDIQYLSVFSTTTHSTASAQPPLHSPAP